MEQTTMTPWAAVQPKRLAVSKEAAFFYSSPYNEIETFDAEHLPAPIEIGGLGRRARVESVRVGAFTGAFFMFHADPVKCGGGAPVPLDRASPLYTELGGETRLLRAQQGNGNGWKTEPVEAKKIKEGDYVVSVVPFSASAGGLAVCIDTGAEKLRAVLLRILRTASRPYLRAPVYEVRYTSPAPVICDGFAVSVS